MDENNYAGGLGNPVRWSWKCRTIQLSCLRMTWIQWLPEPSKAGVWGVIRSEKGAMRCSSPQLSMSIPTSSWALKVHYLRTWWYCQPGGSALLGTHVKAKKNKRSKTRPELKQKKNQMLVWKGTQGFAFQHDGIRGVDRTCRFRYPRSRWKIERKLKAPSFYSKIPSPGVSLSFGVLLNNKPQSYQGSQPQESAASPPLLPLQECAEPVCTIWWELIVSLSQHCLQWLHAGSMKLTVVEPMSKCYKSGTPPTQGFLNIYQHLPVTG